MKSSRKTLLLGLLLSFVLGGFLFYVSPIFGQTTDTFGVAPIDQNLILGQSDIRVTVVKIINIALGLLGIVALGIVLYGGFVYMTAGGAEDKVATARKILVNGTIGLVIILSAFAITRFVLNKLIQATGANTTTENLDGSCSEPGTPYYEKYHGTVVCDAFCNLYQSQCCYAEHFVVKSITPSTPSAGDTTDMYNIIIRALFSNEVAGPANQVLQIFKKNGTQKENITDQFSFNYDGNGTIVEAILNGHVCDETLYPSEHCFDPGEYEVLVMNVKDKQGNELEAQTDCGTFPKDASFKTGERTRDQLIFMTPASAGGPYDVGQYTLLTALKEVDITHGIEQVWNPFDTQSGCVVTGNWRRITEVPGHEGDTGFVEIIDSERQLRQYPIYVVSANENANVTCSGSVIGVTQVRFETYTPTSSLVTGLIYVQGKTDDDEVDLQRVYQETDISGWKKVGGDGHTYTLGNYDDFVDKTPPVVDPLTANGTAGDGVRLVQGIEYPFVTTLRDTNGNAYGDLHIYKQGSASAILDEFIDGPRVLDGSSGPFVVNYGFRVPYSFEFNTNYVAEIRAYDIDSNETLEQIVFRVVPEYCDEPEHAEDPVCIGSNGTCKVQADCAAWLKCLDTDGSLCQTGDTLCECTSWPYIESVTPLNGASGNWVTIQGKGFGDEEGSLAFNYVDGNSDKDYEDAGDTRTSMNLAQCRGTDVWKDTWIIAEVPVQAGTDLPAPNISVRHTTTGYTDYTTDDFGPVVGTFTYNDTKRPGLCSVQVSEDTAFPLVDGTVTVFTASSTYGVPSTPIQAFGKGFGSYATNNVLDFGGVAASVGSGSWSEEIITSVVPFVSPGRIAVSVVASSGERSNPVPFDVYSLQDLNPPVITAIDPATTTPGSYITIYGSNFGNNQGIVKIGGLPSAALPEYCGDTWSDTQIVVKVPSTILDASGTSEVLPVVVERTDNGLKSNGSDKAGIIVGPPRPSICKLDPETGPAPLSGSNRLTLKGENFSASPNIYFWGPESTSTVMSTWLYESFASGRIVNEVADKHITTPIPVNTLKGYSMVTGPIHVISTTGELSNSVRYNVTDCREPNAGTISGFQCCTEGKEAGRWKHDSFICEGGTRDAGYVWRMTTGKIPDQFFVVESCSESAPSPTPWESWPQGKVACLNAQLQARFSLPVDPDTVGIGTINTANVGVFTCGQGQTADCISARQNVSPNFTSDIWGSDMFVLRPIAGDLQPNTWYRIAFSQNVASLREEMRLGVSVTTTENLLATRPCDTDGDGTLDAAYCFDFRTGDVDEICTLVGAGMYKDEYTTKMLGVVQDSRYGKIYQLNKIFDPYDPDIHPLYYFVYGIANQECTVINVDNKPWDWGDDENTPATGHKFPGDSYVHSRGVAKAWEHYPEGYDIFAYIDENQDLEPEGPTGPTVVDVLQLAGVEYANGYDDGRALLPGDTIDDVNLNFSESFNIRFDFSITDIDAMNANYHYLLGSDAFFVYLNRQAEAFISLFYLTSGGNSLYLDDPDAVDILVEGQRYVYEIDFNKQDMLLRLLRDGNVVNSVQVTAQMEMAQIPSSGTVWAHDNTIIDLLKMYDLEITKGEETSGQGPDISRITATSTLYIDLGDPKVLSKWPLCIEACINAEIGAQFDQIMDMTTYANHIQLFECNNGETCTSLTEIPVTIADSSSETIVRAYADPPGDAYYLEKNTWYLVKILDGIHAIGSAKYGEDGTIIQGVQGKSVVPTQWKFRTKNSEEPCVIDNVQLYPDPFTATYIGQKQQYTALPKGAPDACSPYGQFLNPWDYGWEWDVAHDHIATTTNFSMSTVFNKACTINCLPAGSDITKGSYTTYPICGNGVIDVGEDCDIASTTPRTNQGGAPSIAENPGISCSYICLRPGNGNKGEPGTEGVCGNGIADYYQGEECDFNDPQLIIIDSDGNERDYRPYCSDTCQWTGSTPEKTGELAKPVCGSSGVTPGEDCDISDDTTKIGCSSVCLHSGTPLMQHWCDTAPASAQSACKYATSVCGNGELELGEECEVGINDATVSECSDWCLLKNVCDSSLKQCDYEDDEGCAPDCTWLGSSILYSQSSLCWDGVAGIGEYAGSNAFAPYLSCEVSPTQAHNPLGGNPVQLVTAKGEVPPEGTTDTGLIDEDGDDIAELQRTQIFADPTTYRNPDGSVSSTVGDIEGAGQYSLQCGYTEYTEQQIEEEEYTTLNDCPQNTQNRFGVASNSCCYIRPERVDQYPAVNQGISDSNSVCRNTYLEVEFNHVMDTTSFTNNTYVVQGYEETLYPDFSCAEHGGEDITLAMNTMLGISPDIAPQGFWSKVWHGIKTFFVKLFSRDAYAVEPNAGLSGTITWCKSDIKLDNAVFPVLDEDGETTASKAALYLNKALDENVYVAVMLEGGATKIRDTEGVGIRKPFSGYEGTDYWIFRTGSEICKIDHINVEPSGYLFRTPESQRIFEAQVISNTGGQLIVPIPDVYYWEWAWHPQNNPIFNIPSDNHPYTNVTTKGVEGHLNAMGQAEVTVDIFEENNQLGQKFNDLFDLTAFFCVNPWPHMDTSIQGTTQATIDPGFFEEEQYHFSMLYCADDGNPLTISDDLPLFDNILAVTNLADLGGGGDATTDTLLRYLLFSSTTEDVIGIQIFDNPPKSDGSRQTLDEWYTKRFENIGAMQRTSVADFDALTDGSNFYINVYDFSQTAPTDIGIVHNYVYLFSVDVNANIQTKKAFEQIIGLLEVNTNFTDWGKCLDNNVPHHTYTQIPVRTHDDDIVEVDCVTDFDCLNSEGIPLSETGLETNGVCSNQKTKFLRDIKRLQDLRTAQFKIDDYFNNAFGTPDFVGGLESGSFIQGYTNSKWQTSWGRLSSYMGGLPIDPINVWVGCSDHDSETCWNSVSSTFKCPQAAQVYEYKYNDAAESYYLFAPFEFFKSSDPFVSQFIDTSNIVFGRSCLPGDVAAAYQGTCGDGIVNPALEECDPPEKEKIVHQTYNGSGQIISCSANQYAIATCSDICEWNYGACTLGEVGTCGDGIVQWQQGETCDLGENNGQYGKCDPPGVSNDSSTPVNESLGCRSEGRLGGYCGDNSLNQSANGDPLEFCDEINGVCTYITDEGQLIKPKVQIVLDRSGSMKYCTDGTHSGSEAWCNGIVDNPNSRWILAKTGLQNIFDDFSNFARFTLHVFSADYLSTKKCVTQIGSENNFITQLDDIDPLGGTPTKNALEDIYDKRNILFGTDPTVPRTVILVTDGDPSDVTGVCTGNTVANTKQVIEDLSREGISTFVVGFGDVGATLSNNLNIFAEAGGTDNPGSEDRFYEADSPDSLLNVFEQILACQSYSKVRRGSCTFDCQNFGGHCGDGVTQWDYEECDDGNTNNIDACLSNCTLKSGAVCGNNTKEGTEQCDDGNNTDGDGCTATCAIEITETTDPFCGDGEENLPGERCDKGTENGVVCIPEYNGSCTYCTESCIIETVDSEKRCGNGKVDYNGSQALEACDYVLDGQGAQSTIYMATSTSADGQLLWTCSNELILQHSSVNEIRGSLSCDDTCQTLNTDRCVQCGLKELAKGGVKPKMAVLNVMTGQPGDSDWANVAGNSIDVESIWEGMYARYYRLSQSGNTSDPGYMGSGALKDVTPYTDQHMVASGDNGTLSQDAWGIETNKQCSDFYSIYYNKNTIKQKFFGGSATLTDYLASGSYFPYPVDGEAGVVERDFVVSPAVKSGDIRVVVRWDRSKDPSVDFAGAFWRDGNGFSSYSSALSNSKLCRAITLATDGYWKPDPVDPACVSNIDKAWTHFYVKGNDIGVQSYTFSLDGNTNHKAIGFVVMSPNGPIGQYLDYDIWVDVYLPYANQVPAYSIYKPATFHISQAESSDNTMSLYWHVFNIVKAGNIYVPVDAYSSDNSGGTIETDLCQVRENMPSTTKCQF